MPSRVASRNSSDRDDRWLRRTTAGSVARYKARFLAVSTHTPRLMDVATRATDSGRFYAMRLANHHGIRPKRGAIANQAHNAQDMGIVAMKMLKGAQELLSLGA